jgi:hypothetical protein
MSEKTERAIKNGQSRETGNIGYTRQRKTKQKHNTICVWHHHTQRNTYNVNKTWALWLLLLPLRYSLTFILAVCVVLLSVCTLWVPCCDVWYEFRIKTMFGSVVCQRAHVLFTLYVFLCVWWCQTHIVLCFCFVFLCLVYPMLPVSLACPFFIALSVFSDI